jgi:hypothetical protein
MPSGKKVLISNKWKNGHVPGALNGFRKQALMCRADSTDSPGQNFSPFGYKMAQELSVFKIDISNFFCAKFAYSLAPNAEPSLTCHNL